MYVVSVSWVTETKGGTIESDQMVCDITDNRDTALSFVDRWIREHPGARLSNNRAQYEKPEIITVSEVKRDRPDDMKLPPFNYSISINYEKESEGVKRYGFVIHIQYVPEPTRYKFIERPTNEPYVMMLGDKKEEKKTKCEKINRRYVAIIQFTKPEIFDSGEYITADKDGTMLLDVYSRFEDAIQGIINWGKEHDRLNELLDKDGDMVFVVEFHAKWYRLYNPSKYVTALIMISDDLPERIHRMMYEKLPIKNTKGGNENG